MGVKVELATDGTLLFWCPGCNRAHGVGVEGENKRWEWNGHRALPTLKPSLLVHSGPGMSHVCHSYVTDGRIEFLKDSTHALAGQTVDLPDWE